MGLAMVSAFFSGMVSHVGTIRILGTLLGVSLCLETARLRSPKINDTVLRVWGPFMRSSEINSMSGFPPYVASSLLAVVLFPKPIAALCLLFLACGDPLASVIGILYGDRGPRFANGKSLIGTLGGVATCVLISLLFWNAIPGVHGGAFWALVILGGLAGGLAELVPWDVDDNFAIPVVSGFFLWVLCVLLGVGV